MRERESALPEDYALFALQPALPRRASECFHGDARVLEAAASEAGSEAAPSGRHRALQFVVAHASAAAQSFDT